MLEISVVYAVENDEMKLRLEDFQIQEAGVYPLTEQAARPADIVLAEMLAGAGGALAGPVLVP